MSTPAKLALEDGTVYTGVSIGAAGEVDGEVCFNTSMTGYQEILTDPSYRGQIVTMTFPQIGNYGVNEGDLESARPHLAGFVVREHSRVNSNFRSEGSLGEYLKDWGVVAIESIDTRALVRRIRSQGAMRGVLSTTDLDDASLVAKAKASPGLVGRDLVSEVVPDMPCEWQEPVSEWTHLIAESGKRKAEDPQTPSAFRPPLSALNSPHVVALDYGMKWNIPRHLFGGGCQVTVLPGTATAEAVLAQNPDGVFLSNGPGDPEPLECAIGAIRGLLGKKPVFGICLGHQLLSLACGAKTFKLKFGHRGANHPVLAQNPDGVFLSNGPGDPEPLEYAIGTIRGLLGKRPVFGICLGHQLLSLACGARTFKLKFGHRGANHPVQRLATGAVEITSQNHGFAVDEASLPTFLEVTHRSLNDGTIEGVRHRELAAFSVQYHPEASAGPHDSHYLFQEFLKAMRK